MELLTSIILTISEPFVALAAIVIVWHLRGITKWRSLRFYVFILGALYLAGFVTGQLGIHNWWLYQIVGFAELLLTYPVYRALGLSVRWKVLYRGLLVFYLLDSARVWYIHRVSASVDTAEELYLENPIGQSVTFVFILVLGFNYLYQLYLKAEEGNLLKNPAFLINAGFMVFASQAFYLFLISTEILNVEVDIFFFDAMWVLLGIGHLIKYSLLIISVVRIRNGINAS